MAASVVVADFNWRALTERRLLADADHPLAERLALSVRPFDSRSFKFMTRMTVSDTLSVSIDLGRSSLWHSVRAWTLTHAGANGASLAQSAATDRVNAAVTLPVRWGQVTPIHVPVRQVGPQRESRSGSSWLRTIRLDRSRDGRATGTIQLVSQRQYTEQRSVIAAVLLDKGGLPVASAETEHTFRVTNDVYSENVALDFGELPISVTPTHLCAGFAAMQIGAPMGSFWGRFGPNPSE